MRECRAWNRVSQPGARLVKAQSAAPFRGYLGKVRVSRWVCTYGRVLKRYPTVGLVLSQPPIALGG